MNSPIETFSGVYRWLSNFWPAKVEYEGLIYPSVEHAYQAAKTLSLDDREVISKLSGDEKGARMAKKAGKVCLARPNWDGIKVGIMTDLVRQKFKDPNLRAKLLETGDAPLVEGNWWGDRFWGVCKGSGQNKLGEILMKIRDEIQTSYM